ncbi:amidase [Flavobacteriaceae bacterium]|nr:amidase [Flavobacteriaceae bacterium]
MRIILFACLLLILGCNNDKRNIELTELTIAEIHSHFQKGTFNSKQLVTSYLEQINKYNTSLNAITFINEEALKRAEALDQEFKATGKLRPLHGIPVIVKDNVNTEGLPTTAGSLALKNYFPDEDAHIIKKLKENGAIILAKSNMAEWAFTAMLSESSTHGISRNPYNTDHVTAGSSGGTGAAIAANFGTLGIGTDTGNSIRGPSSHNGLVGFRTTIGLTSISGIVPLFVRNDVVGPMCRTVADATKFMQATASHDPRDKSTYHHVEKPTIDYTKFLIKSGLKGARIGVVTEMSYNDIHPDVLKNFQNAIHDIRQLGATVIDSTYIDNFEALRQDQWCRMFRIDVEDFLRDYVKNDSLKTVADLKSYGSTSEIGKQRFERNTKLDVNKKIENGECLDFLNDPKRIAFRKAVVDHMDALNLDALIYPSWNYPPAPIVSFLEDYKGDNSQIIAPHTGQPAFTIPMGYTQNGLPTGIQFLGRLYDESTLVKLTYSYEQGTLHRKAPDLN